ncbi:MULTISPECIES: glycosyltransferase family 4 protein [Xanthomonas]|uniref:Glycosyltransferase family 1 protein n=1 Tax=Xanthomonas rydalmerensis TaxID=3046274 RepID=A0ABZ0JLQ0_9XANT|nr:MULTISPECIES: glycosyltransferase family 1 protein [unclassified Xanthomonas]MBB5876790.1 glycosyltransferase involved in cell wall biosynthesis [Xanthomonas sp. 3498]WOS39960.1 glycosyltransferase family 1 protein [Xanthomonas sp. DM-2023]WOS44144.1 glycosyltransferase family 1 protein [Xanthomonas sp. DM-2023]WOS48324.1 glycosyltransferase family 1 protein [Xanthomonas sp. DM-2023]WOS52503.1 glycosyltransferase family 1 protein [Xanthomonas sp. DM-2023]
MRYAIVTETYPPEVNGVALTVQGLELGLRARGHSVDVVRPRQAGDADPADLRLVRGAALPRYPGLKFGLPAPRRLTRLWQAAPPDAVYIATEGPLGWSALRSARRLGIPIATGFHTRFDEYLPQYGAAWLQSTALRWMRRFHNQAQATLVPTRELRDFLATQGFERVRLLARAVDSKQFEPQRRDPQLRQQWGLQDDDCAVLYVGRIASEKNLPLAVRAFRQLQQLRPRARFVWVGDGPLRERLAQENPDFIFCGVQRGDALARHFASGDLFLFPSRSETFGNVTLEAMASGLATVAFDYGAAREYLRDGSNGAAVADDDAFIAAALRLGSDEALRRRLGAAACASMQQLRPERVVADFDALLNQLAQTRRTHVDAA